MLGIVFTTPQEASIFVDRYADARVDRIEAGSSVQLNDLRIAVTGIGKIKATLTTERLLRAHDLDTLIHAGACTALDDFDPGTVVGASFVLEGDRVELDAPTYPRMPLSCPLDVDVEGTLVSQDHTAEDNDQSTYWERLGDVRDSTGYAVAYVAAQHGAGCHIVKAVSTGMPSADASLDPQQHEAAGAVATVLEAFLSTRTASSE